MNKYHKFMNCPFCGSEVFNHFGQKAIIHKNGCPMLNGYEQRVELLTKCQLENWDTRQTVKKTK